MAARASREYACPGCSLTMERRAFARQPVGTIELDLCFDCRAIWFDQYESGQLTPGAVLELFKVIERKTNAPVRPLRESMRCPQCDDSLRLTHDMQRNNRFTYYRCAHGHGRLTTFFQFLREKNFIRSLTDAEMERLKANVAQVRCSSCGAPVNIERDAECGYCHAPISILDVAALQRTIAELGEKEQRRTHPDPQAAIDALLAGQRFERRLAQLEGSHAPANPGAVDLVGEAVSLLFRNMT
jgi:Zn-finger nucleic acid-binding protein